MNKDVEVKQCSKRTTLRQTLVNDDRRRAQTGLHRRLTFVNKNQKSMTIRLHHNVCYVRA